MNAPIVVAIDLTARSDRSFDRAVMLATQREARLVVVHAIEQASGLDDRKRMQRAAHALDRWVEDLEIPFELVLEHGAAPEIVAAAARKCDAALVVVGAARYNHVTDFFLGTAVDYLVRCAPCPVLVVKDRPRTAYDGIVVGTDFSRRSARALAAAMDIFDLPVTVVNAFGRPFPKRLGADTSLELGEVWSREEMERFLALPEVEPRLARIHSYSVESNPSDAIERYAELYRSPVAVVGSHGWGTIAQALLGSRASDLLASIPQDVLIVRDGLED